MLSKYKKVLLAFIIAFALLVCFSPMKDRFILSNKSKVSDKGSLLHRISIAYISWEIMKDYPVFGTGFGIKTFQNRKAIDPNAYNARLPEKYRMDVWGPKVVDLEAYKKQAFKDAGTDNRLSEPYGIVEHLFKRPHNMFLSVGVRMGFVGLFLFLYLLFVAGKMCFHTLRKGKNGFFKGWGYCLTALFFMFLVKGSLDPVFTHLTEVALFTILAMITIVWKLNMAEAENSSEPS